MRAAPRRIGTRRLGGTLAAVLAAALVFAGMTPAAGADVTAARTLDAAIAPVAVPTPATGESVITVKVGSDRTDVTGVTPLPGVTLLLNTNTGTGSSAAPSGTRPDGVSGTEDGWAKCVSDSNGDCSFVVPDTGAGGAQNNTQPWVLEAGSSPDGYYSNPVLRVGSYSGAGSQLAYRFRMKTGLQSGVTYTSQTANQLMLDSGSTNNASGGIWQHSRTNPPLGAQCGLDVALILDLSASVGSDLPKLKDAANTFVHSLVGTSSRMSLFSFSTNSPATGASGVNYPDLTAVTTQAQADAFTGRYSGWRSDGFTNWDRGLGSAAAANTGANAFQVAVIITDGSPTNYNSPPEGTGTVNRFRETEAGIFSANAIKAAGTRVIAFGVGDGATGANNALNLRAISGETKYDGTNGADADFYQTSDYDAVGKALRALALGNCEGTLNVTKQIVPATATPGSIEGATPAGAGWVFTGASLTDGVTTPVAQQTTTANGTGTVGFPLTFTDGISSGELSVAETQQDGYTLTQVGGKNAVCTNLSTGDDVTVTNDGDLGFRVDVPSSDAVNCTVYNRQPNPAADLTVNKTWVVNGDTYPQGGQPGGLSAQLNLTGPGGAGATPQGWGVVRTGYTVDDAATLTEDVSLIDPELCTNVATVTEINGESVSTPLGSGGVTLTLSETHNTATITNTVTCRSTLSLVKRVVGGTASASAWTLSVLSDAGDTVFSGATGTDAVTNIDVTPTEHYQLAEDAGDPLYAQVDNRTDIQVSPHSTGSATCIRVNEDGSPFAGSAFSDGINGGVRVPLGYRVACTLVNETATLSLAKTVVNDDGGTAAPRDWTLTATPDELEGLEPTSVTGADGVTEANTFPVRPGHTYALTESALPGYRFAALQRLVGTTWQDVVAATEDGEYPRQDADGTWLIRPTAGANSAYRFVNDDVAPVITLVKHVDNRDGVGAADASAWTLTADGGEGHPGVSGTGSPATGDTAAISGPVTGGVPYALSESGPDGYRSGGWRCTVTGTQLSFDLVDASTVVPQVGTDITCEITNTAEPASGRITKAVKEGWPKQRPDGAWEIVYDIVVTNTSATSTYFFTLRDGLHFGSGISPTAAEWSGPTSGTFADLGAEQIIDAGGALVPTASATYTVTVTAEIASDAVGAPTSVCSAASPTRAFRNTATLVAGTVSTAVDACAEPWFPTITKTADAPVQSADGTWEVSYGLSVANPGAGPLQAELADAFPAAPAGWAYADDHWSVVALDDAPAPSAASFEPGATGTVFAGSVPANTRFAYAVRATLVPTSASTGPGACETGGGLRNAATVVSGLVTREASACVTVTPPTVSLTKTVTSTSLQDDGRWRIVYDIVVTGDAALSAVYSLSDTLTFGGGIAVDTSASGWTGPTAGSFGPSTTARLAADRVIAAGGVETYTVTAYAAIDPSAADGDTLACDTGATPDAGGFLNVATVTAAGTAISRHDCSEPSFPVIAKQAQSVVQVADDPDGYDVSYLITVTAGASDGYYDLTDTPEFAAGLTIVDGSATRVSPTAQGPVGVTSGVPFATGVPIAAGAVHSWTVTWRVERTDAFDPADQSCTGEPGSGLFNAATVSFGGVVRHAQDCVPLLDRVYPSVTKRVAAVSQDARSGDWTITYEVAVALAATPEALSATYDLTDTLEFGTGIRVVSAVWSPGDGQPAYAFTGESATLARGRSIASGATHVYTVTAVASLAPAELTATSLACDSGAAAPEAGGFLNAAVLVSGDRTDRAFGCAQPQLPTVAKSAEATTETGDGTQTVAYLVTVTAPAPIAGAPVSNLGYSLTESPEPLPAGVERIGEWRAEAIAPAGLRVDRATWDGEGEWGLVRAAEFAADERAAVGGPVTHTYRVFATVVVNEKPAASGSCGDGDEGAPIWNGVTLTIGEVAEDARACAPVHWDDVTIEKTAELPGEQSSVEPGDVFDYVLTVVNRGTRPATQVHVTDHDLDERLQIRALSVSGDVEWAPDPGYAGRDVDLTIARVAVGQTVQVRVTVEFLPAPTVVSSAVGDEARPEPATPLDRLTNTACVQSAEDDTADCDTATVPTRDITAAVYTTCRADAPLLGWTVRKSGTLALLPIHAVWTPDAGTASTEPAQVTLTALPGQSTWSALIDWPGTAFTPSGIPTDYPGWRQLSAADYAPGGGFFLPGTSTVMTAEEESQYVFNGLILDPSELDFAWRSPSTLTFSVNPSLSFDVTYPAQRPECVVARHADVRIVKSASAERLMPGEAFDYTIDVANVSEDGAADGVVVTDVIPATVKVTGVTWDGRDDADVFPNWSTCRVTGQDAAGFGGTLACELFGPLQPAGVGISAAPRIRLAAVVGATAPPGAITNVGVVEYHTFDDPGDSGRDTDDAVILVSLLPATGAVPLLWLGWGALTVLVIGAGTLLVVRDRRRARVR